MASKALLEVAPPILTGAGLGWVGTILLVRLLGPSERFEPGGLLRSALVVGVATFGALLLLGSTAGGRSARLADVRATSRSWWWVRVPWELLLLLVAAALFLRSAPVTTPGARGVGQVDAADVALPLLVLTGVTFLAVRLLVALLPLVRPRASGAAPSLFLASRRVGGAAMVVAGVAVFTAQPVGVYLYAAAIADITESNLQSKSATYSGAEVAIGVAIPPGSRLDVAGVGTPVSVITGAEFDGQEVQILGVEPASFARFAVDVTDGALPGLMQRLRDRPDGAILVTAAEPTDLPDTVALRQGELDVEVVATVPVFPGMRLLYRAVLVVDRTRLADLDRYTPRQEEVWTTRAGQPALLDQLEAGDIRVDRVRTPDTLLEATDLLTVTWAFGYLRALALLAGSIGVAGLLLYLNLRSRRAAAAYVLARRMGLRPRAHLTSLVAELLAVLGVAWAVGAGACLLSLAVAGGRLDVDPDFPPMPQTTVPTTGLTLTAGLVVVVALLGALLAQRVADRTDPAASLRGHD